MEWGMPAIRAGGRLHITNTRPTIRISFMLLAILVGRIMTKGKRMCGDMGKHTLEDYLFTLEICRKELPGHAHPVHYERLREIEAILKRVVARREQVEEGK